jgi:hypothetical protein
MNCVISTQSASVCQADMLSQLIRWAKSLQIKPQLKALVRSLIDYWNISKSSPFPSIRRLAAELCVSRQTVHKYLNQLELAGIIARKRRFRDDGGRTSNVYRLLFRLQGHDNTGLQQEINNNEYVKHAAKRDAVYISEPEKELPKETDNKSNASSNSAHKSTLDGKARAAKDSVIASNYAEPRSKDNLVVRVPETGIHSRGNENREQTSCSTPRHSEGKPTREAKLRKRQYKINEDKMTSLEECQRNYSIAVQKRWIDDSQRSQLAYFSCWAKVVRKKREGVTESPAALLVYVLKNELLHVYPDNVDEQKALRILRELRLSDFNSRMAA